MNACLIFTISNYFQEVLDISNNNLKQIDNIHVLKTLNQVDEVNLEGNQLQNVQEILQQFNSTMGIVKLCGNNIGKLNTKTLENLKDTVVLDLTNTNLSMDDFGLFSQLVALQNLIISSNNLDKIKFSTPNTLDQILWFYATNCKITNINNLLSSFGSTLETLVLTGTRIGEVNSMTFRHLTGLTELNLRNTTLSFGDLKPFESNENLYDLDLSYNDLRNVNLSLMLHHLEKLNTLSVSYCNITELSNSKLFGLSITQLDLSGNFVSEIESSTFGNLTLKQLNLANMNLSHFDSNVLANQPLEVLNLSQNHLKEIDLTHFKGELLEELHLEGNELTVVNNLTHLRFPSLEELSITQNKLPRKFLSEFNSKANEWPNLKLIGDLWNQKNYQNSTVEKQRSPELVNVTTTKSVTFEQDNMSSNFPSTSTEGRQQKDLTDAKKNIKHDFNHESSAMDVHLDWSFIPKCVYHRSFMLRFSKEMLNKNNAA